MRRLSLIVACLLWFVGILPGFAQNKPPADPATVKYDDASRVKLNGVVDDIEERSLGGGCKAPGVFVIVKADGKNIALQVGPKWFVDELSWKFSKGDKLDIVGWKTGSDDSSDIVVRKITHGEWIMEPRDDSGGANWLWMPAPKDSGKCK